MGGLGFDNWGIRDKGLFGVTAQDAKSGNKEQVLS